MPTAKQVSTLQTYLLSLCISFILDITQYCNALNDFDFCLHFKLVYFVGIKIVVHRFLKNMSRSVKNNVLFPLF